MPDSLARATRAGGRLRHLRVGIVGGGFAGLAAGWFLQECGVGAVTVFEAVDRLGGRVHTDRDLIPGRTVEAGAELIGANHDLWQDLADRFGLDLDPITTDDDYKRMGRRVRLRLLGQDLTDAQIKELKDGLIPHLDVLGAEAAPIPWETPWTSPDADRYDSWSVADRLDRLSGLTTLQRAAIEFTLGNDACAPVGVQSYLGLLALISAGRTGNDTEGLRGYWEASEVYRCLQGNQTLADRLGAVITAGTGTVRTGTRVTRIDILDTAAATITTAAGDTVDVDHVVLAVPAPQWPGITIEPPLPAAEFAMAHGPAVKFVSVSREIDWPGGGVAPSAKSDELGSVWDATDRQQPPGPPRALTLFAGGEYVLSDEDGYADGLAALFPAAAPESTILVDWSSTGYSVPHLGQVTTVGKRLSLPFAGCLRVSGEQASLGFYGYMEGALHAGVRSARAVLLDVLGALPSETSGLCLPLGHLAAAPQVQRLRCAELAAALVRDPAPFAGDRVDQRYTVDPAADPALLTVSAPWPGAVAVNGTSVTVEMLPAERLRLGALLGEDGPVPIRVTVGPVDATVANGAQVVAGASIGTLAGSEFRLRFQDQYDFHLHPLAVLDALEQEDQWSDTGGARCPLLPEDARDVPPMAVAGPRVLSQGAPHLVLSGGSRAMTVHNPPEILPSRYFSFLSRDPITITLASPPAVGIRLSIADVTDPAYRTADLPTIEVDFDAGHTFVADDALRPQHPVYGAGPAPGRDEPAPALTYEISFLLPGDAWEPPVEISQDVRDVIRQEYLFHSPPHQPARIGRRRTVVLAVPDRDQIEQAVRPVFATHFTVPQVAKSNYVHKDVARISTDRSSVALERGDNLVLHGTEAFQVAEYLRGRYAVHIRERRAVAPAAIPDTVTPVLNVGSTWRNPERNEYVNGVQNSNHNFGDAIDLDPPQATGSQLDIELLQCLFAAGGDFLRELIARNGVDAVTKAEIFLEYKPANIMLKLVAAADGSITEEPGGSYDETWGMPPTAALAAEHSSHVHVAWRPTPPNRRLELPPAAAEPPDPVPAEFRNIVLVASEASTVPDNDQLPLNHIADAVEAYLHTIDPSTPTDVHVVGNAIDWLRPLQAFGPPQYKIRRLFSFSHAWPGGLTLTHHPGSAPYSTIRDTTVLEQLNQLYDPRLFADTSAEVLPEGEDDLRTVKTHQIRISNLRWLPDAAKARIRKSFVECEGVYIAGCRAAQEDGVPHPSFCAELADLLGQPVRGAAYYSKVFSPGSDGEWHPVTLTRRMATPAEQPVVLVPGSYGTFQLAGFVAGYGLPPPLPPWVPTSNLLEIYDTFLQPVHPGESP